MSRGADIYYFLGRLGDFLGGASETFRTSRFSSSSLASTPASLAASKKRLDCSSCDSGLRLVRFMLLRPGSKNLTVNHLAICRTKSRGRIAGRWPSLPWTRGSRRRLTPAVTAPSVGGVPLLPPSELGQVTRSASPGLERKAPTLRFPRRASGLFRLVCRPASASLCSFHGHLKLPEALHDVRNVRQRNDQSRADHALVVWPSLISLESAGNSGGAVPRSNDAERQMASAIWVGADTAQLIRKHFLDVIGISKGQHLLLHRGFR